MYFYATAWKIGWNLIYFLSHFWKCVNNLRCQCCHIGDSAWLISSVSLLLARRVTINWFLCSCWCNIVHQLTWITLGNFSNCFIRHRASICLQHCERPKSLSSLPSSLLPSYPLPLEVVPLNPSRGLGERCKLPQWGPAGRGEAPVGNDFGAFSGWRNAAGAWFETSKNGLSLRFYEEVFHELTSSI